METIIWLGPGLTLMSIYFTIPQVGSWAVPDMALMHTRHSRNETRTHFNLHPLRNGVLRAIGQPGHGCVSQGKMPLNPRISYHYSY